MSSLELKLCLLDNLPPSTVFKSKPLDLTHIGVVSTNTLLALTSFLGLRDEFVASIRGPGCKYPLFIRLYADDTSVCSDGITVSPGVFYHLSHLGISAVVVEAISDPSVTSAESVTIAQICVGPELPVEIQRIALKSYLAVPRLASITELLGVPLWGIPDEFAIHETGAVPTFNERDFDVDTFPSDPSIWPGAHRFLQRNFLNPIFGESFAKMVWFEIVEIAGGNLIDFARTKITCVRAQAVIPPVPGLAKYFARQEMSIPLELQDSLTAIQSWLTTAQKPVIVTGPKSSGKSALLNLAASRIGVHAVSIDLSSGRGSDLLKAVIQDIRRLPIASAPRPVVLVILRGLDSHEHSACFDSSIAAFFRFCEAKNLAVAATAVDSTKISLKNLEFFAKKITVQLIKYEKLPPSPAGVVLTACAVAAASGATAASALSALRPQEAAGVDWDEIGGLDEAKLELRELLQTKTKFGRKGVLLFGPPGTGKTLLARAVAKELIGERNGIFLSVKGPELLSAFIGESEANLRGIFMRAKQSQPAVIFFDEIDSLAPARGRSTDSAMVMDRIVSSLLSELDDLPREVFILAATNRPDLLDAALTRPGRLDRSVYIGPGDPEVVFRALTHKGGFKVDGCPKFPANFTGADVAGVLKAAQLQATLEAARNLDFLASETKCDLQEIQVALDEAPDFPEFHEHSHSHEHSFVAVSCCGSTQISRCFCGQFFLQNLENSSSLEISSPSALKKVEISRFHLETAIARAVPSVSAEDLEIFRNLKKQYS